MVMSPTTMLAADVRRS
nr:unnamed protein product [Callosobruchus analis]